MFEAHRANNEVLEQRLNNMQLSTKTFLNTVYGITGTKYSPIGNRDIAQTITRQGKLANTSANKFIGEQFKEMFNVENYKLTTGGDTDSLESSTIIDIQ
jgi:DNA polymerase elongation subunit (family B)